MADFVESTNGREVGISLLFGSSVAESVSLAVEAEARGFGSAWSSELFNRSCTVPLAAIAERTASCAIGSAIMYGFSRAPITIAAEAHDLDELSGGRFVLGLGTGTRRMIADWAGADSSGPASRVEELVPLIRQLWNLHRGPIDHEGRFYRLRIAPVAGLTRPPERDIPIYTAGVNPRMIESAGRVSDGLLGHALFTEDYIRDTVMPALQRGATHAGRDVEDVKLVTFLIASIHDDFGVAEREAAAMIAFYASVRTYTSVFEDSGFGAEARLIRAAFRDGDIPGMVNAVSDEMVHTFAAVGDLSAVQARVDSLASVSSQVVLSAPSFLVSPSRVMEHTQNLLQLGSSPRYNNTGNGC